MEDKVFCSICFTNVKKKTQMKQLKCDHKFHMKCIWKWLVKNPSCPICRVSVNKFPEYDCPYNEYVHYVNAYMDKNKNDN